MDYSVDNGSNYTTYYYLRNAQNDIVKIVDSTGAAVVEYIYDSWGKIVFSTGSLANTVGTYQPFRYRGYVYDDDLGLYYLQSRYYDPSICRFISSDVYLSTGQGVIGHNSFAYCLNNPIYGCDPNGFAVQGRDNEFLIDRGDCGYGGWAPYVSGVLDWKETVDVVATSSGIVTGGITIYAALSPTFVIPVWGEVGMAVAGIAASIWGLGRLLKLW